MSTTASLKVGLVLDDTLDSVDGVQQYVLSLGRWLSGQGHQVRYLVGETTRTDIIGIHSMSRNVKVRFNGNRMSVPLPADRPAIRALLEREKFDVLHVQVPYSPFMAGRIIQAAPSGTAVIGTFHIMPHSPVVRLANRTLALWERRTLKRFDAVVAVSEAAASFAKQTYQLDTEVVPNVIDLAAFQHAHPRPELQDKKPVLLFLGRLVPRKGCLTLLKAVKRLREDAQPFKGRVVICGKGPLADELKDYVKRAGLSELVSFTGFIDEADKPDYLVSADIVIYPSLGGESFGIVLAEAMAVGHPVVLGADNPGYHSVLGGYPELLFTPNDDAQLADTLRHFLSDNRASRQAVAWQTKHVQQFDTAVVGRRLTELYTQTLRAKP